MKKLDEIKDKYLNLFLIVFAIGFLAHGFALTNKLLNHDDIDALFAKGSTIGIGRWGLVLIAYIFPNISMPWYNGIFALLFLAISACLVVDILDIKDKYLKILIGCIIITFPSITGTFSFMFTSTGYAIGILFSIMSVKLVINKKIGMQILGVLCLLFSLSLYQAYISLTVGLLIILLIKQCMTKEIEFGEIIKRGIKFIIILIASICLYYLITMGAKIIFNANFTYYQGFEDIGKVSLVHLLYNFFRTYIDTFVPLYVGNINGITNNLFIFLIMHTLCLIISGILISNYAVLNKNKKSIIAVLLWFFLPVGMNFIYLLNTSENSYIHGLMIYGNVCIYILPIVLYETCSFYNYGEIIKKALYIIISIIVFIYITYANEAYFKLHLTYENTYSFYNTLVTRIENTEGFKKGTRVLFCGSYRGDLLTNNDKQFKDVNKMIGINGNLYLINSYAIKKFIDNYIGISFEYVNDKETIMDIVNTDEFRNMGTYPYYNSIKKINDIMVVKFIE